MEVMEQVESVLGTRLSADGEKTQYIAAYESVNGMQPALSRDLKTSRRWLVVISLIPRRVILGLTHRETGGKGHAYQSC